MLNVDDVVAAAPWDWNRCTVLGVNVCWETGSKWIL
jgi:hypothetical protein